MTTTSAQRPRRSRSKLFSACCAISGLIVVAGCGKKGPPLPPLVKLPTPPANFAAARRGDTVELEFTVPQANTDSSRPANVTRVDVYAVTGPAGVTDAEVFARGVVVGSVAVKAPRDPNLTTDPDEPEGDDTFEPPEGKGLDQGAMAHLQDALPKLTATAPVAPVVSDGPLLSPPASAAVVRTYLGVPIAKNGRKGRPSARATVALVPPPPAPPGPRVTFDENAVTVTWAAGAPPAPDTGLLTARPFAMSAVTTTYQVYETPDVKLTKAAISDARFIDARMDWGVRRCYTVRAVQTIDKLAVESAASAATCVMLADTFPPAPPKDLKSVGTDGAISLIWEASPEKDLDGYLVLRGLASGAAPAVLAPITPAPIHDTTFRDGVDAGVRYIYAVQAVDTAGNVSQSSNRVEEAAR